MVTCAKDINWTKKADKMADRARVSASEYDVRLSIISRRRRSGGHLRSIQFRFTDAGRDAFNGATHMYYYFEPETACIYFAPGDEKTGFSMGIKAPWGSTCRADAETAEKLSMYQGRYKFNRLDDGTLYIKLQPATQDEA